MGESRNDVEATPEQIAAMAADIADQLEGFDGLQGNLATLTAEGIMRRITDAFVLIARPGSFPPTALD